MGSGGGPGDQVLEGAGNHEEDNHSLAKGNKSDLYLSDTKSCISEPAGSVTSKTSHISVVQANDWISGLREKRTGKNIIFLMLGAGVLLILIKATNSMKSLVSFEKC